MGFYASSFISGFQEPVRQAIKRQISDVKVMHLLDGFMVYRTHADARKIEVLKFLNNSYAVIETFNGLKGQPIRQMLHTITRSRDLEDKLGQLLGRKRGTFRIIASHENNLVSMDRELLNQLERRISRIKGLRVDRSKPDIEFWFLYRSENIGFFMMRLTRHTAYEKVLHKGELRPELAYLLCDISEPKKDDVFLDPFCGYGAIPLQRAISFPYREIYASDQDKEKLEGIKRKLQKNRRMPESFHVGFADALHLDAFEDESVDKIVTDPPWGIFEDIGMDIREFYCLMLEEFIRILKPQGNMVILTARKSEFEESALKLEKQLSIQKRYDILVSGKKAAVYKILKKSESC